MKKLDESLIPEGIYCHDEFGMCPYWSLRKDKPSQENGYCKLLKRGDWEETGFSLLWDACKECGINEGEE